MFNGQMLYDRTMSVKMDRMSDSSYSPQQIPNKLPSGLSGIGMGLGAGGAPVNMQQMNTGSGLGMSSGTWILAIVLCIILYNICVGPT